ncbi:membrane protein insertion efficiency factor YidD [Motiliproteus sp. SC1-56]|uniref:membrane protein insertion efficiency factor YidD n=1 Tax=Motiliproteus sp. SC1-56 TaxID=2799565 RepID=UPI001A8E7C60|nr:membrane protein insertion efficiency factor YidD [Motiliproteus sp. SC1-56]
MANPAQRALKGLIRGYQLLVSPVLGSNCRFYPTCSAYALQAIEEHGAWRGLYLGLRRLLRCHPFHPGGIDLVPPSGQQPPEKDCCGAPPSPFDRR